MTEYVFQSPLDSCIENFINQKRAIGYPYRSSARILHHFDLLVAKDFAHERTITKDICAAWLNAKPGEHPNGLGRRISPVRQLGKYMKGLGYDAYIIPGHIPNKHIKYEAHIYTPEELRAFFTAIDNCPASPFSPTRCYVIPIIFRLLYCCGLRPAEALYLHRSDVNLETGKVTIRESKGWKTRIVYMSQDMQEACKVYDTLLESLAPDRTAFFPNKDGNHYNRSTLNHWFHEFWDKLPQSRMVRGNPPRVHDFRHSYAVHRLNQWVQDGEDINALYPYLSQFMGHSCYADTDYYLSLVEDFYPEMEQRLASINDVILPAVYHGEE